MISDSATPASTIAIALTVNGKAVSAEVAPRMHLADFLRENLALTGTHIGCEHGVCGACTVEIDGEIARSCITFAAACDGAKVRTIEDFDEDPLMARLRSAFASEHALQCGYCTPGMLIAARDLIRRRGRVAEREIRVEMSGNLCRCTGYIGIVRAIERVMADEVVASRPRRETLGWLGPSPGPIAARDEPIRAAATRMEQPAPVNADALQSANIPRAKPIAVSTGELRQERGLTRISQSFVLPHALDRVWSHIADLPTVIACVPGASLDGTVDGDGRFRARIAVRLGPIRTSFAGAGLFIADPANHACRIEGSGHDQHGPSVAQGELFYRLHDAGANATRVEGEIGYSLSGPLAQFNRPGLVHGLVARLGADFAENLKTKMAGVDHKRAVGGGEVRVLALLWAILKSWLGRRISGWRKRE
jgi:aerobic carbon-monoxide dehydrogenase small subunit